MGCANGGFAQSGADDSIEATSKRCERVLKSCLPHGVSSPCEDYKSQGNEPIPSERDDYGLVASRPLLPYHMQGKRDVGKDPNRTVLLFDWDDTLCPTTWARTRMGFRSVDGRSKPTLKRERDELFKRFSAEVVQWLSEARTLGSVVLVTNATRPWLAACCESLMPEAQELLEEIPIVYAMELLSRHEQKALSKDIMYTEAKTRAMSAVVNSFCKPLDPREDWINIVSIGDSSYEHDAIREVVSSRRHSMSFSSRCYTKTIKTLERPTLMKMQSQLSALSRWFSSIVHVDSNLDVDLAAPH